jgi:hypothetical protein
MAMLMPAYPTYAQALDAVSQALRHHFPALGDPIDGAFHARVAADVIVRDLHDRRMLTLADRRHPEEGHDGGTRRHPQRPPLGALADGTGLPRLPWGLR